MTDVLADDFGGLDGGVWLTLCTWLRQQRG